MAGPDWSLLQTPDYAGDFIRYQRAGQDARQEAGERKAWELYAADPKAGMAELTRYAPKEAMVLQQQQRETVQADEDRQRKRFIEAVGLLGGYGRRVRTDQDMAALKTNPLFQQIYAQASADLGLKTPLEALTLEQVNQFNTEASKLQGVNLGNGGYGTFDPDTGTFNTLREPDRRPVIVGNGGLAYDPDSGEVVARNAKTFAPPRAGGGGANIPPPPSGWRPASK